MASSIKTALALKWISTGFRDSEFDLSENKLVHQGYSDGDSGIDQLK